MVKPPSRPSSRGSGRAQPPRGDTNNAPTSSGRGRDSRPGDDARPKPSGPRGKFGGRPPAPADDRTPAPYGDKPHAGHKRGAARNAKPYGEDTRGAARPAKPYGDKPFGAKPYAERPARNDARDDGRAAPRTTGVRGKPRDDSARATPRTPQASPKAAPKAPPKAPIVYEALDGGTPHVIAEKGERIAKLLARAGIASRREVERLIEEGRVRLDDVVIETPATILTTLAGITVDGEPVRAPEAGRLWAFHKPPGLLTAERDPAGRPTIYTALRNALPPGTPRLMPVGRLDLNTEGLLLLTNDGELKRAMELPSSLVPRTYRARTFGDITQSVLEGLMEGIEIEGIRYGSINANMERSTGRNQWIELTLSEGKNREVRRVLEHLGLQVSRLIRVRYGPFMLDDLPRGMAVPIRQADVENFRGTLKKAAV